MNSVVMTSVFGGHFACQHCYQANAACSMCFGPSRGHLWLDKHRNQKTVHDAGDGQNELESSQDPNFSDSKD
jgi:hypothetical protein